MEHKNEQWPEYRAALFADHRYLTVDCLRKRVWKNDNAQFWYAQNIMMFRARRPAPLGLEDSGGAPQPSRRCDVVDRSSQRYLQLAEVYQQALQRVDQLSVSQLLRALPRAILRSATKRMSR